MVAPVTGAILGVEYFPDPLIVVVRVPWGSEVARIPLGIARRFYKNGTVLDSAGIAARRSTLALVAVFAVEVACVDINLVRAPVCGSGGRCSEEAAERRACAWLSKNALFRVCVGFTSVRGSAVVAHRLAPRGPWGPPVEALAAVPARMQRTV